MGIHCLLPFLRKYGKNVNVKEFSGQIAAVDASCWLHKGLSASLARSGRRDSCADIFHNFLRIVKQAGVTPFVVFDGLSLPAKESENEKRRREKERRLQLAEATDISVQEANRLLSQAVNVTFTDVTECINEVQMFNKNAALSQGTDIPSFNGEFVQYAADNVDHNIRTLDGHNTFPVRAHLIVDAALNALLYSEALEVPVPHLHHTASADTTNSDESPEHAATAYREAETGQRDKQCTFVPELPDEFAVSAIDSPHAQAAANVSWRRYQKTLTRTL
ncbi:Rad2 nuclease [Porites harrisoni]